jgi:hypothetical protein
MHHISQFVLKLLVFSTADFFDFIPQFFEKFGLDLKHLNDHPPLKNVRYSENFEIQNVFILSNYYKKIGVILFISSLYPTVFAAIKITKNASKL